jgi:integrase
MRKRGNRWYIRVNGVRKSAKTDSRAEAAQLEKKLNAEAFQRKHFGIRFSTWGEACVDWFKKNGTLRSAKTQSYWEQYWTSLLGEKKPIPSITGDLIRGILLEREGVDEKTPTRQNNTANQYAGFVVKILKHAGAHMHFEFFPELPGRDEWLTREQWFGLEIPDDEERQHVTFSLATGLRKGNVIGFQWGWLRDDDSWVLIPPGSTKTNRAYGLPLNKTAQAVIKERRRATVRHPTNVFTLQGEAFNPSLPGRYILRLHYGWKRILERSGVPDMPYHGLRHTYASWMVQAGVPFEIISRLCQWKLKGMVNRYTHFDVESLRQWTERFDEIVRPKTTQMEHTSRQVIEV